MPKFARKCFYSYFNQNLVHWCMYFLSKIEQKNVVRDSATTACSGNSGSQDIALYGIRLLSNHIAWFFKLEYLKSGLTVCIDFVHDVEKLKEILC